MGRGQPAHHYPACWLTTAGRVHAVRFLGPGAYQEPSGPIKSARVLRPRPVPPLPPTGKPKASRRRAEKEQRGRLGDGFGDEMVTFHPEAPGIDLPGRGVRIQSEVRDTETIEVPQRMGLPPSESTIESHRLVRLVGIHEKSKV